MDTFLLIILCVSVAVALAAVVKIVLAFRRYRIKKVFALPDHENDIPTVSVCIPARNETHALADCLQSVLQSDYPKLEVIVLDDCSQDQTSALIRSFAHAGVRFVQGREPSAGWLGKNHAYEVLASEASGRYIVFMSVDTRVAADTISQILAYALAKKVKMVSVLPRRVDEIRASIVFATLRYFWQLLVPQRWHTPTATSLWVVERKELFTAGGFAGAHGDVLPENKLARSFDHEGSYRFLVSSERLGVSYAKKWTSQIETSIRLAYPLLWKQPVFVIGVVVVLLGVFFLPYFVASLWTLAGDVDVVLVVALCSVFGFWVAYGVFAFHAYKHGWWLATVLFPVIILQEAALLLASMVAYWRGVVSWKGRNVCYPVLRRKQ